MWKKPSDGSKPEASTARITAVCSSAVAEAQEGVEPVHGRPAAPRGIMQRLGNRRVDQPGQALEVADGRRALQAAKRVAVGGLDRATPAPSGAGPGRGAWRRASSASPREPRSR